RHPENREDISLCLYRIGESFLKGEKWFDAADSFKKLAADYPENALAVKADYMAGVSYYRSGARSMAIPHFKKIADKNPSTDYAVKGRYFIALALAEDMDWKESEKEFAGISSDYPLNPLAVKSAKLSSMAAEAETLPSKSPALSGAFSAVIPGMGQLYSERYRDALSAFLYNGILGYLTYDSHKDGRGSAYVFGTLTGVFYLSNIYGAVNSAQNANLLMRVNSLDKLRKEAQIELLFKF
ncbi:tetratricopeptide repeat protein, partial [bacterium]|nr:tetratricopeptide repeat protein [bacterium]